MDICFCAKCLQLYFAIGVLVVMFGGMIWARNCEKKIWNNGYCDKCGSRWECFDVDSQGGRGYKCKCRGPAKYGCWISYNVDKNYVEPI